MWGAKNKSEKKHSTRTHAQKSEIIVTSCQGTLKLVRQLQRQRVLQVNVAQIAPADRRQFLAFLSGATIAWSGAVDRLDRYSYRFSLPKSSYSDPSISDF